MRDPEVVVRFRPSGLTAHVLPGTRLVEAAARAGIVFELPCGGEGTCGKCRARIISGAAEPTPLERERLSAEELQAGWRLACQTAVRRPMEVDVPWTSLSAAERKILVEFHVAADSVGEPSGSGGFAVAFDIGTTTLAGMLVELGTGAERAVDARLNPQTRFGDDVLSRIHHARSSPNGASELHAILADAVDEMIGELCRQAGVSRDDVSVATAAGNTTMQHLLAGVDPSPLGEAPFTPATRHGEACPASDIGLHIHPRGEVYLLPIIGGFVGGDTVAGMLATGLADAKRPAMLVDIGTNGEIALAAGGHLSATSTAAGPAFEGARISCGMRAAAGAIEEVVVDGRLRLGVIGGGPPVGLCGSGLIDAAAELLRHRLLTPQGRLLSPDKLPDDVPPDLAERVVLHDGHPAFTLAAESETADGRAILLTQRDIRELQLAAGAVRAGARILLRRAGLTVDDLDRLWIAGGFGNFIRRANAQRIGLLPGQIDHRRIRSVGNTSLAGARLAALSREARAAAENLARRTEHIDLSTDAAFHREFAETMLFPGPSASS